MENISFNNTNKELLDYDRLHNNILESTEFTLFNNFLFYFNSDANKSITDVFIEKNYEKLRKSFQSIKKTFIIVNSQNIANLDTQTLKYYFPNLDHKLVPTNLSTALLKYFDYSGSIQSGLLACNSVLNYNKEISLFEINKDITPQQLEILINDYVDHLKLNKGYLFNPQPDNNLNNLFNSPLYIEPDEIEIDDDSKEEVQLILNMLNEIRDTGSFIALLPLLEKHLYEQNKNDTKLSRLHIDQDFKIWLVDYNLEVKLSHLTKSIFFLFLAMGHKIDFLDLKKYDKCLINIYKSVSNQENLDKMLQSVNLLIRDNNAIYVHLSRIKSAFHKLVYKDIADKYCIKGAKGKPKGIELPKTLTNIDSFLSQWDIDPGNYIESVSDNTLWDEHYFDELSF